jgi:hypothetical protein
MGDRVHKRPYVAPQVVRLDGGDSGSGSCTLPGSSDIDHCTPGNNAVLGCNATGSTAAAFCNDGSDGALT